MNLLGPPAGWLSCHFLVLLYQLWYYYYFLNKNFILLLVESIILKITSVEVHINMLLSMQHSIRALNKCTHIKLNWKKVFYARAERENEKEGGREVKARRTKVVKKKRRARRMQARRGVRRGRGSDYSCEIQQDHSLCSEEEGNYLVIFNSQSFMLISSHNGPVHSFCPFSICLVNILSRIRECEVEGRWGNGR